MFNNFGPSPEMLQRLLPMIMAARQQGQGGIPGMGGGISPPGGGGPVGPMIGGGSPPIMDTGPTHLPPGMGIPNIPGDMAPSRPLPMQGIANKMNPNRPGMWGKFNTISQALQPMAMQSLMGSNRAKRQGY